MQDILRIALSQFDVSEIPGIEDNETIKKYFTETNETFISEEISHWCAVFMKWCAEKAGYKLPKNLNLLRAKNWQHIGEEITDPALGDICVFWRLTPTSGFGHVGLYINETEFFINLLGGNQNNKVSIAKYNKSNLICYRRLK